MKFFRVLFVILIATVSGIIIHSCCGGYGYRFIYIISRNYTLSPRTANVIEAIDSASRDSYGIRIHLVSQKIAHTPVIVQGNDLFAAYDCWPIFTMEDSICDIRISTVYDFSENKSAGDDVSDSFLASSWGFNDSTAIHDKIVMLNDDDMDVAESLDLFLSDAGIFNGWHQFVVTVLLSDNRMMKDTTDIIKIY
jgi:hypothetical protein